MAERTGDGAAASGDAVSADRASGELHEGAGGGSAQHRAGADGAMMPGDIVTFWYRKFGSNRSSRVWCRVESINTDGTITARLPPGWDYPTRTLPAARFTRHEQFGIVSK